VAKPDSGGQDVVFTEGTPFDCGDVVTLGYIRELEPRGVELRQGCP